MKRLLGGLNPKTKNIITLSLTALLILIFSRFMDVFLRNDTFKDKIEKGYNQKRWQITDMDIDFAFKRALHNLKEKDKKTKEELFKLLKNKYKDFKHKNFLEKRIKELDSNPNSAFKQKIEKFNILLISKKETDIIYKVLKIPRSNINIDHDYKNLTTHKIGTENCELINFYDCQDIGFVNPKDGDLNDLKKALDKLEIDENPNNSVHAVWYYIDEKTITSYEIPIIERIVEMFKNKKVNIFVVFKKDKGRKEGIRIIRELKQQLKKNVTFISNLKDEKVDFGEEEDEKFHDKLLKITLTNTTEVFNEVIIKSTLGNIINDFIFYAHSINYTSNSLIPSFNLFIEKMANYFQVSAHGLAPDSIMDFYYKQILFKTYEKLSANMTEAIIMDISKNMDYSNVFQAVFDKVKNDVDLYNKISMKIFAKFKEDVINVITSILAEDSQKFKEIIYAEIKPKLGSFREKIRQKKKNCFHNLGYDF